MDIAERIEPLLLGVAARCLRIAPAAIDTRASLARYGLDSLSAVELSVALAEATGIEIDAEELLDAPSIHDLAERLLARSVPNTGQATRLELMRADTDLSADIDPSSVEPIPGGAILLTGATGFLGAHLLKQLLLQCSSRIVCPVRADNDAHAGVRMRQALLNFGVAAAGLEERVAPFAADIGAPRLGRTAAEYRRLTREVSSVLHCAAQVNWALGYEALRAANVCTTENLLRFAATAVRKSFHFVSSVAACYSTRTRFALEEDDAPPDLAGIHLGYGQSKWVAERLIEACRTRGLSATLYRPSLIAGDSASGQGNDEDLLALLMRGCIELGYAPELDWRLDACPVDFVAQAIVHAACAPPPAPAAVHVRNPRSARWTEAVLWMNLRGYRVRLEPFATWIERAERASRDPAHALHRLRGFLLLRPEGEGGRTLPEIYADPAVAQLQAERSDVMIGRFGLECPRLDSRLLERYFDVWVARGILPDVRSRHGRVRRNGCQDQDAAIESRLRSHYGDPHLTLTGTRRRDFGAEHSILGELAAWHAGGDSGMHTCAIEARHADGTQRSVELVVKPRYADSIVLAVSTEIAWLCGAQLGAAFAAHSDATGLMGSTRRELGVYARATGALRVSLPAYFGVSKSGDTNVLLLERVHDSVAPEGIRHPELWLREHIEAVLRGIGRIHAEWLGRETDVDALLGNDPNRDLLGAHSAQPLWDALSAHARPWLQQAIGDAGVRLQVRLTDTAPRWLSAPGSHPGTLIHNDFNPRNFVLRAGATGSELCAFDWELAQFGLPQRDLIELLCFVLAPEESAERIGRFVDYHRRVLENATQRTLERGDWQAGVRLAIADFGVRRLPMYFMAHRFRPQPFLQRVTRTWLRLAQVFELGAC